MSGYSGPTNDPWDAIKRRQEREHEAAQEANRPGRTQTFQSVRKLWNAIVELRTLVLAMQELFNRMPQNDGRQVGTSGWAVDLPPAAGPFQTVATATIPRPQNINRAAIMAVGSAAGTADVDPFYNAAMQGRIVINGSPSEVAQGTLESNVNTVRSSLNMGFFQELSDFSDDNVTVELQVRGRYDDYPASNVASLSVSVGFTRVGS